MFCPSPLFCYGDTMVHRTAAPRDVPGSRLLPILRAATLQSGSPPKGIGEIRLINVPSPPEDESGAMPESPRKRGSAPGDRAQGRIRATYPLVFRVNPKSLGGPGLIPVIRAYGKSKHSQDTDRGPGGSGETICRKRIFASSQAIDPG